MNKKELEDLFDKYDVLGSMDLAYGDLDDLLVGSGVEVELVYENDWGEDASSYIEVVYKLTNHQGITFVEFTGHYDSWGDSEVNDTFSIVEPYQEMVTRYKKVK